VGRFPNLAARGPSGFGFPWPDAFEAWKGRNQGLEKLGFPWILSSETSLINRLHGIFVGKKFVRPFALEARVGAGASGLGREKRGVAHETSLTRLLIFCNEAPFDPVAGVDEGGIVSVRLAERSVNPLGRRKRQVRWRWLGIRQSPRRRPSRARSLASGSR
jgi:hypothetical protein